jgi:hypothetical protein
MRKYWLIYPAFSIFLTLGFFKSSASGLPEKFLGVWVAEGSFFSHTIREIRDPEFGINYLQYRFERDGFCVSFNPFETARCFGDLKISGDTLSILGVSTFLFEFRDTQRLSLTRLQGGLVQELTRPKNNQFVVDTDSTYQSGPGLHPTHKSLFSSIFFFNSLVIYPAPRSDQPIVIEFTVTSRGQVKDIKIISPHSKLRKRWFRNSMLQSSGEWYPATIRGTPVNCRIKLELMRVGYKTLEAEEKAWKLYSAALRYITKSEYAKALIMLNDAMVYLPGNARFLFTRAACHFYLKDEKRQCEDVLKAKETCPFIPTAMADEELGILVECFKH